MTSDDYVAQLDALNSDDPEKAHSHADTILLACVPKEVRDAYYRLKDRTPWWACA